MHTKLLNRIHQVDALLGTRLHVDGPLRVKLQHAQARLPRTLRKRAGELVQAQQLLQNPVLATRLDPARVVQTCALLERHLKSIPQGKYRRRDWSALIGLAAWRVLLVVAAFAVFAVWIGQGADRL